MLAEALGRAGVLAGWLGDLAEAERRLRGSLEHAESVGDARVMSEAAHWIALGLMWGPTPDEALLELRRLRQSIGLDQLVGTELKLGQTEAHETLDEAGERGYLSTVAALLARSVVLQVRHGEAEMFADEARQLGAEDDRMTQLYWRAVKAQAVAARGEREEAARLAAETVELALTAEGFDTPIVLIDVADSLEPGAKRAALEHALAAASAKGNAVTAAAARARLEALA